MLTFFAITVAGILLVAGGALFGHDHDHDGHGFDHGADHGADHGSHDADHGNMPTVSIFSTKVVGTFVMGFGAAGFLATYNRMDTDVASLIGVGTGFLLGLSMYGVMRVLYSQQGDSLIYTNQAVGKIGIVTSAIEPGALGKVDVGFGDISQTYLARAQNPEDAIARGSRVRVAEYHGSELVVERVA